MDTKQLWEKVLSDLEVQISKANFTTWFKDTYISRFEDGSVFLSTPNTFVQEWLYKKFHQNILRLLRTHSPSIHSLEYIISKEDRSKVNVPVKQIISATRELPLNEYYINKEDNLNPRYTFDSFIIGSFNELAHAASQAVIKNLGLAYNPFFVYGNTGHGKTHLIQAIGNHVKTAHPSKKVFYLTSEKFTIDYVNSLQANKVNLFKEKYRKYDVIIMDDVQFFSNKDKFQEELFHFFNTFHDTGRQLIFSSDRHPNVIPGLEDRLRGRFSVGMIVDIPEPDHESRIAIVKTKCKNHSITLPIDVIEHLASSIEDNIREIEGIVNVIACQTQLKNRELNLNEVKAILKNNTKPKKMLSVKEVVKVVSEYYNVDEESIYNKTRRKEVVRPRQ